MKERSLLRSRGESSALFSLNRSRESFCKEWSISFKSLEVKMMIFFRRYQQHVFGVIAVFVLISFCFFGMHPNMPKDEKIKDRCIGRAIDGSKIMKSEVDQMVRFLKSDRSDAVLAERGSMPNFFNDGVIRKDFLEEGIGLLLVDAYFDALKGDLEERAKSHRHFRPYVHPSAPFISLKNLWAQVLPKQKVNLERFFEEGEGVKLQTVSLLADLYLGQAAFPPHILREYLLFQEKSCDWIRPDPALPTAQLSLFGCGSLEDWFGRKFLELSAQFIINSAAYAKKQGHSVSKQEAQIDLFQKGLESLQMHIRKPNVKPKEVESLWQKQLQSLNMEEKDVVALWQKVLLFRRLFHEIGGSTFVDPYLHQAFYEFALKTAKVDLYHLPKALEINDFFSFMELEYYLDQVSKGPRISGALPDHFASIDAVEKRCPQLIQQRFLVQVGEVQKEEVALNVSLKEMWDWQLEKENYELLKKEFPQLRLHKGEGPDNYFAALEKVDPFLREKIDRFSRRKIVDCHPEWIQEALNQKHVITKEIQSSPTEERCSFGGKALVTLFKKALLKEELDGNREAVEARKKLEMYSEDGDTYYRFHILDRDLTKSILTFEEAKERGILASLLDEYLEHCYSQIRSEYPEIFKTSDGDWKPLKDVKHAVGKLVYAKRLEEIEGQLAQLGVVLPKDRESDFQHFYPKYHLYPHLFALRERIIRGDDPSHFLREESRKEMKERLDPKIDLASQWKLIKTEKVFKNCEKGRSNLSSVFAMEEASWSEIFWNEEGAFQFFQLKKQEMPKQNFSSEIKKGQTLLSRESKRHFMSDLLKILKEKQGIYFSNDNPEGT